MREVLTFILAGGKGERLDPLTRDRAKPAVPFGGIYRIIDFTLSNCVNSGLRRIYVLIQYKSFSLQKHILAGWRDIVSSQLGEFIDLVPAQQRIGAEWYRGTADAIYQNTYAIHDHEPELVLILAGDHVYKMNYEKMIDAHQESGADTTVACIPMPVETSSAFGVIEVDADGRVCGFQEKPARPRTIPGDPSRIFASMGIYLFGSRTLLEEVERDAQDEASAHDFGRNVIPRMLQSGRRVMAYNFVDDRGRPRYWRDIGTRDAYYQANMDLVRPEPAFDLYDRNWPVRTYHAQYPPVQLRRAEGEDGLITDTLIAGGCQITGARVHGSVLSPNVRIEKGARVERSVVMEGAVIGEGAVVRNAILDKQVVVPPGGRVGCDADLDRRRFDVTRSGIVIVPKRVRVPENDKTD